MKSFEFNFLFRIVGHHSNKSAGAKSGNVQALAELQIDADTLDFGSCNKFDQPLYFSFNYRQKLLTSASSIRLENVRHLKPRYLALLITQFIVGLVCLFFVFNAVIN